MMMLMRRRRGRVKVNAWVRSNTPNNTQYGPKVNKFINACSYTRVSCTVPRYVHWSKRIEFVCKMLSGVVFIVFFFRL